MSRFNEIMSELQEALNYEKENKNNTVVHKWEIMDIPNFTAKQIREIRKNANIQYDPKIFRRLYRHNKKAVEA